jgi:Cdc6-like AAA superfamily ATPase
MAARGGCLYVSGVPGTGKTATVREVVRQLQEQEDTPPFEFVEINCMHLTSPEQAYTVLWQALGGERGAPRLARLLWRASRADVRVQLPPFARPSCSSSDSVPPHRGEWQVCSLRERWLLFR